MTTERDLRNQMAYARKEAIAEGLAEGREKGLAEGRAEGWAEGRAEGVKEVAVRMLAMGMSVEQVAQATLLDVKEVEDLR